MKKMLALIFITIITMVGCNKEQSTESNVNSEITNEVTSITTTEVSITNTSIITSETTKVTTKAITSSTADKKEPLVTTTQLRSISKGNKTSSLNIKKSNTGGSSGSSGQKKTIITKVTRAESKPSKTTTVKKAAEKPKPKPVQTEAPKPKGFSQTDISAVNNHISSVAASYGFAGVNFSGSAGSWNSPLNTSGQTVSQMQGYAAGYVKLIYDEVGWEVEYCELYIKWTPIEDGNYKLYIMWG